MPLAPPTSSCAIRFRSNCWGMALLRPWAVSHAALRSTSAGGCRGTLTIPGACLRAQLKGGGGRGGRVRQRQEIARGLAARAGAKEVAGEGSRTAGEEGDGGEDGEEEGAKFVELESGLQEYGPPALLLLGFSHHDATMIRRALVESGAGFVAVALCTQDLLKSSVWEAMQHCASSSSSASASSAASPFPPPSLLTSSSSAWRQLLMQQGLGSVAVPDASSQVSRAAGQSGVGAAPAPAPSCVAMAVLSGLTGEDSLHMVDLLQELETEPSSIAFAVMLPGTASRKLREVVEDVLGDHALYQSPHSSPSSQ